MTPTTAPLDGFFVQLMPMLADRTLMVIVSKLDDQHVSVSVVPKRMKESENPALATPLCCTGTPEELDRDLATQLREFVAGHVALGNNLAQIQCEREEAEKAAREELKKKQKTVGNGGARSKVQEPPSKPDEKAAPATTPVLPSTPSTLNLFDAPPDPTPQAEVGRETAAVPNGGNVVESGVENDHSGKVCTISGSNAGGER